jgi:hypothetical protein
MYILELTLKGTPATLSVQKKEETDATAAYQQIVTGMKSGADHLLELTCDHQAAKKLSVFASAVCAVQVYEKTGGGSSGRSPGFFAVTES